MNRPQKLILSSAILLIAGCAQQPATETTSVPVSEPSTPPTAPQSNDEITNQFVNELLEEKILTNGSSMFCEQPNYVQCYNISESECHHELSPLVFECYERTNKKVGKLDAKENSERYGTAFALCLGLEHLFLHSDGFEAISECIGQAEFDQNKAVKSLLK